MIKNVRNMRYLVLLLLISGIFTNCNETPKDELIANYESKEQEIKQLYEYVNEISTDDIYFDIEFKDNNTIAYFDVWIRRFEPLVGYHSITRISADGNYNGAFEGNKNFSIKSKNVDNLLNKLGWTRIELNALKQKLDKANCISVENRDRDKLLENEHIGDSMTIGYKRMSWGICYYKIFNQPLSDNIKRRYSDENRYFYYKDNIILEYKGEGVIGS